jgi:hypothetical protein
LRNAVQKVSLIAIDLCYRTLGYAYLEPTVLYLHIQYNG